MKKTAFTILTLLTFTSSLAFAAASSGKGVVQQTSDAVLQANPCGTTTAKVGALGKGGMSGLAMQAGSGGKEVVKLGAESVSSENCGGGGNPPPAFATKEEKLLGLLMQVNAEASEGNLRNIDEIKPLFGEAVEGPGGGSGGHTVIPAGSAQAVEADSIGTIGTTVQGIMGYFGGSSGGSSE